MVPRAEIEGEMGDSHVGLQARLMSQAMRKLTSVIGKTNTVCVFINQLREKVGVMYGNPEVTTGAGVKVLRTVRIDCPPGGGPERFFGPVHWQPHPCQGGQEQVAPPFREAEFDIMFGKGISKMSELVDVGVQAGHCPEERRLVQLWGDPPGPGRDNAKQFLADNPEIANDIESQIRANADKLYSNRPPGRHGQGQRCGSGPGGQERRQRGQRCRPGGEGSRPQQRERAGYHGED